MSDSSEVDLSEFSEEEESSSCSWTNESSDSYIDEIVRKKSNGKAYQKASKGKKKTPQLQAGRPLSSNANKMAKKSLFTCTTTSKSVQRDLPQPDDSTDASMSPTSVTCSSTSGLPTIAATPNRTILSPAPTTSVLSPATSVLSPTTSILSHTTSVLGSATGIGSPASSTSGLDQHQGLFTKLRKIESQQEKILEGQKEILTLLSGSNPSQRKRNRKVKISVPNHVRTTVHDGYSHGISIGLLWKMKSDDGNQTLKPSSDVNKEMTEHICQYVLGIYPDCKAFVKESINRYFQSMQDKERRIRKGRVDSFKKGMVLYQRKKRKMEARLAALKHKTSWDEEKKKKVEAVLMVEYMSSEYENDSEDDTLYEISNLKWRSEECLKIFKELDTKSSALRSKRSKRQSVRRVRTNKDSSREKPDDISQEQRWAIRD